MPRELPLGLARQIPKGADLVLRSHFHPSGKVERVVHVGARVKVTVRLADGGAVTVDLSREEHLGLGCVEGDGVGVWPTPLGVGLELGGVTG